MLGQDGEAEDGKCSFRQPLFEVRFDAVSDRGALLRREVSDGLKGREEGTSVVTVVKQIWPWTRDPVAAHAVRIRFTIECLR